MKSELRCLECGKVVSFAESIEYSGARICAACKPMFVQRLKEGAAFPTEFVYAGFWVRLWALSIDMVLHLLVTLPILIGAYGWDYLIGEDSALVAGPLDLFVSWILPAVAVIGFWKLRQATPGKMVFRLKVMDAVTGEPATNAQYIGRYFAYIVSILSCGIGFIWAAFDPKKQGIHDKLARTIVIRARA